MDDTGVKSSSYDVVMAYVETKIGKFTPADVLANCPGVGRTSVFNALKKLNEEGFIDKHGEGKGSFYVKKVKLFGKFKLKQKSSNVMAFELFCLLI